MTVSSKQKKDRQGWMLIALVGAVAFGVMAYKVSVGTPKAPDTDGCSGTVTRSTVIVLDHSETLTNQTRAEITARALAYVDKKAEKNERITVFNISESSKKAMEPSFSRCKPKTADEGNRMVESVRSIEKSYQQGFLAPLTEALSVPPVNAQESPIGQALIDISLSKYLRTEHNSLLVFSDLMEHTPKFSLYSCGDAKATVAKYRESRQGAMERPKFSNTTVVLNVVPRTDLPKPSLKCRDALWPWFFGNNEGNDAKVDFDYLPGA